MKQWFTLAGILIVVGGLIFTLSACSGGWNFGRKNVEKTVTLEDGFSAISIETDTADISILPSEDGSTKVVSSDIKKIIYNVSVENGVLKIKEEDTRRWFESVFNMSVSTLTVYLPESEYASLSINESTGDIKISEDLTFGSMDIELSTGDIKIYSDVTDSLKIVGSTGDVKIEDISCGSMDVQVSTGDVNLSGINCSGDVSVEVSTGDSKLSNVTCANFNSEGDTGSLIMNNVIATDKFSIKRDTGDVKFNRCDASEIYVKTDTGDVTGTLLSEKIFITKTDTGSVKVPESYSGGKCKIETDTGDIKISIAQ